MSVGGAGPDKEQALGMARLGGGEPPRWGRREWLLLALALVPLAALIVVAFVAAH